MDNHLKFRIATRGFIVQDNRLLFVSDNGDYWYLPGGRLEGQESLTECVEREIYEETGLIVRAGDLLHVLECFDFDASQHKIHFYFQTTVLKGDLTEHWQDKGGNVQFRRYFSLDEIKKHKTILPRFLASGGWDQSSLDINRVYQGTVLMRGFEMLDEMDRKVDTIDL